MIQKQWLRLFGLIFLGGLLLPVLRNNLANVQRLQGLDLVDRAETAEELAWEQGWQGLCSAMPAARGQHLNLFAAQANIDRGDFVTAKAQFESLSQESELAQAYWLALNMDWLEASQHYRESSSARHRRFWATIFYLAAQQAMFAGDMATARGLYERADAGYGMYGPFHGLALGQCLADSGRVQEAFDIYRRALVILPPSEALTHLEHFNQLRLSALQAWQQQQPSSAQIAHWLEFFSHSPSEVVSATVQIGLGNGQEIVAFGYRPEDIETGPFMTVDFQICQQNDCHKVVAVVLNQAANGAFLWDAVPDGIRPTGWHTLIYSDDLRAVEYGAEHQLCLNSDRIGTSFGLQGEIGPIGGKQYVQGSTGWAENGGAFTAGRTWFVGDYAYSYIATIFPGPIASPVGLWEAPAGSPTVAVWLIGQATGRVCVNQLYFFALPDL